MGTCTHTPAQWGRGGVASPLTCRPLTSEVSAVQVSPQRPVAADDAQVSADGGQSDHRADVQQAEDAQQQLGGQRRQAEDLGERHGWGGAHPGEQQADPQQQSCGSAP